MNSRSALYNDATSGNPQGSYFAPESTTDAKIPVPTKPPARRSSSAGADDDASLKKSPVVEKQPARKPASSKASSSPTAKAAKHTRKRKWRKPKDMPKRPLSAYNIFFKSEREEMIKAGTLHTAASDSDLLATAKSKMGFAGLARTIGAKWKSSSRTARSKFEKQAELEQSRYKRELEEWKHQQEERKALDVHLVSMYSSMQGLRGAQALHGHLMNDSDMDNNNEPDQPAVPSWPTMPQTIASLGNMYDGFSAMRQHASLSMGTDEITLQQLQQHQAQSNINTNQQQQQQQAQQQAQSNTNQQQQQYQQQQQHHHQQQNHHQQTQTDPAQHNFSAPHLSFTMDQDLSASSVSDMAVDHIPIVAAPFASATADSSLYDSQRSIWSAPELYGVAAAPNIDRLARALDDESFDFISSLKNMD